MRSSWRDAWRADLPDVSRPQARTLVVTLGLFWGCFALAAPALEDDTGVALVPFFVGFAAGWYFYAVLARVWGTRLFIWPGGGYFAERRQQMTAVVSLVRPSFIARVLRATGWPPAVVGAVLVVLLAAAMLARP